MDELICYLLTNEGQDFFRKGQLVHDCDIKLNREEPMQITKSKVKHLVYVLNTGDFTHEARCTLIDLVPNILTGDLFNALEDPEDVDELHDLSSYSSEDE